MKTQPLKILMLSAVLAGGVMSCKEKEKSQNGDVNLKNLKLSLCNDNLKSAGMDDEDCEYINYSAVDNKTLKFEHKFFMNCCVEDIGTTINTDENTVTINMTDDDADCNCICSRIANYEIVNLRENETYKFVFLRNGQEYHTCEILFTIHADGEIQL